MSVSDPEARERTEADPRVESMLRRDLACAVIFTCAMWLVLVFVYVNVVTVAPTVALRVVLGVSMITLGAFNTASIIALVRRYRHERDAIYGEDLRNLDLARAARKQVGA
ncbi:MAG: hypothetical protein GEV10_26680 [Streptosporangiales bacterium]|nr:hypothetical protein [Streptosporangiales bacterium]